MILGTIFDTLLSIPPHMALATMFFGALGFVKDELTALVFMLAGVALLLGGL